jgi:glycerol kinase
MASHIGAIDQGTTSSRFILFDSDGKIEDARPSLRGPRARCDPGSRQDELRERWSEDKRWEPAMDGAERARQYAKWKKAVERTFDWADE